MVSILKSSTYRTGWEVQLCFQEAGGPRLHKRDLALLEGIKVSLGGIGHISFEKDLCIFRVRNLGGSALQLFLLINFFWRAEPPISFNHPF